MILVIWCLPKHCKTSGKCYDLVPKHWFISESWRLKKTASLHKELDDLSPCFLQGFDNQPGPWNSFASLDCQQNITRNICEDQGMEPKKFTPKMKSGTSSFIQTSLIWVPWWGLSRVYLKIARSWSHWGKYTTRIIPLPDVWLVPTNKSWIWEDKTSKIIK